MINKIIHIFVYHFRNRTLHKYLISKIFKSKVTVSSFSTQNIYARKEVNYHYDCSKPKTFNEFIGWLKIGFQSKLWERCADKLEAKQFLSEIGFIQYVPKLLGVYNSSSNINLEHLPEKFVLKTNHNCGSVFICEKGKTDFQSVFSKLDDAINTKYSISNGEWVYSNIKPIIFAEEFIEPFQGDDLFDYKFFIYSGHFKWGYVAQGRRKDLRISVFEKDFSIQRVQYAHLAPTKKCIPKKPIYFDKMVKIAESIGQYFDFVRVDLYETNNGPMIGELTFFPFSGKGGFSKYKYDLKYGSFFKDTIFYKMKNG